MNLQIGDRITDETGEWEVVGRPYTTNAGKDVHGRVQKVVSPMSRRSTRYDVGPMFFRESAEAGVRSWA